MKPVKTVMDPIVFNEAEVAAARADPIGLAGCVRVDFQDHSMLYFSGIAATDDRMEVVGPGDMRRQTEYVLERIQQELHKQGGTMKDIVRTRTYVVGLSPERFNTMNQAKAKYFRDGNYTTGTLVEVSNLAIPGLLIEIEVDAILIA